MTPIRTPLLQFPADDPFFTAERWFFPLDTETESITRAALVWHGDDTEYVAILGPEAVQQLLDVLSPLAELDDTPSG